MSLIPEIALINGFLDGLKPEPILTVSEWADSHRMLSPVASAEPGPYRTARAPYLREIMDKLSANDPAQVVDFMKAAQIGATEAGNNWIGYIIDAAPGPCLMVMPTDETVKRNSKIRIAPMIDATPRLRKKVSEVRSRDGDNNTFQKSFPGGVLIMTGANSAAGLRSMPIRFLMLDEIDAYPDDLDGEGSPIELAIKRTATFARKKIFKISTPTVEGTSKIQKEYNETDQRKFFVPCPECGTAQELVFEQIKFEPGQPETARYCCIHCGEMIEERRKTEMLNGGSWVATVPENASPRRFGYHLNALYAPFGWFSWADAVREYLDALKDVNKMKTFVNTVLGLPYQEEGEVPQWENLYNRRGTYGQNKPSKEVCLITAGADVQRDRIEVEIVGWCKKKVSYSLDYRVLHGDTSQKEVWDQLAAVVGESWLREDNILMPLRLLAVDSGYNTNEVYSFARRFDATKVIPVKGQDNQNLIVAAPKGVDVLQSGKKIGRVKVWHVGVSVIKSELYGWLRQEAIEGPTPDGFCFFPQYDAAYFRGLTAEKLTYKVNKKGFRVYEWIKHYDRNEPLDCRVYARAAASVAGIDRLTPEQLEQAALKYALHAGGGEKKKDKPRRPSIWD